MNIWGDGTYLYVAENTEFAGGGATATNGIEAWQFNGTAFTLKGTYTTAMNPQWVWGDGTTIFVADSTNGVKAFSFNGTTFTLKGTYAPSGIQAMTVWGDGTYLYVYDSGNNLLDALTFSGTTWTLKGSMTPPGGCNQGGIWGDGTYLYMNELGAGLYAYTFNGTSFTQAGRIDTQQYTTNGTMPSQVFVKNGNIYVVAGDSDIDVFSFTGTTFTYKGAIPGYSVTTGFWSDGAYLYFNTQGGFGYTSWLAASPACN
jgi:hypothetical protein